MSANNSGTAEFFVDVLLEDQRGKPVFRITSDRLKFMTVGQFKDMLLKKFKLGNETRLMKVFANNRVRSDYEVVEECCLPDVHHTTGDGNSDASHNPDEHRLLRVFLNDHFLSVHVVDVLDYAEFQLHKLKPEATIGDVRTLFAQHRSSILSCELRLLHGTGPTAAGEQASRLLSDNQPLATLRRQDDGGVVRLQTVVPSLTTRYVDPKSYDLIDNRTMEERTNEYRSERRQRAVEIDDEGNEVVVEEGTQTAPEAEADENAGDEGGAWDEEAVALANSYRQLLEDMRENWRANDRFAYDQLQERYALEDELYIRAEKIASIPESRRSVDPLLALEESTSLPVYDEMVKDVHIAANRSKHMLESYGDDDRRLAQQQQAATKRGQHRPVMVYGGRNVDVSTFGVQSPQQQYYTVEAGVGTSPSRSPSRMTRQSASPFRGDASPALEVEESKTPKQCYHHYPPTFTPRRASGTTPRAVAGGASAVGRPLVIDVRR